MDNKGYEIDLLPVGEGSKSGDAILLRFGDLYKGKSYQRVVLIDGGYKGTAKVIKSQLIKFYNCKNDHCKLQIDLMILTHPDVDHVSGLVELANDPEIQIECIMMHRPWNTMSLTWFKDGRITRNSLKKRLQDAFGKAYELDCATQNVHKAPILPGTYPFFGAKFHIIAPSKAFYESCIASCDKTPISVMETFSDGFKSFGHITREENYTKGDRIRWYKEQTSAINETSFVILFEYNGTKILFTGDAGINSLTEAIAYAQKNHIDLSDIDVIKMPHHGSRKNVTPDIMDQLGRPGTACCFSCVSADDGHHPSKRLVNMLNQKGFRVYTTQGEILHHYNNIPRRTRYILAHPKEDYPTMETI